MKSSAAVVGLLAMVLGMFALPTWSAPRSKKPATQPATQPADDQPVRWHKIRTAEGVAKPKPTFVKFQPATHRWRLRVTTAVKGEPTVSHLRLSLMQETARDVDEKPMNWMQVAILWDGKPGDGAHSGSRTIRHEYTDGVDERGEPRWFQLAITGQNATFDVLVEDQAPPKSRSKPSGGG
jgi:hypothetical protein